MGRYPSEFELKAIREWNASDPEGLLDFIASIWEYADFTISVNEVRDNSGEFVREHVFSTGGWSGNEDIIYAMMDNLVLWGIIWYSSTRGGHYAFRIPAVQPERKGLDNGTHTGAVVR